MISYNVKNKLKVDIDYQIMIKLTKQKQKSKDFTTKNKKYCNEMSIILV